jgi:hypothetical protein
MTKKLFVTSRQYTVSHFTFQQEVFFTKNNMTDILHPAYFYLFPQLKMKLKGCHFDTIEVMEAESQAVLNSLTELGFQDAFKNGRSAGNGAYTEGNCFEGDGGQ